jgi:hypothetical protein
MKPVTIFASFFACAFVLSAVGGSTDGNQYSLQLESKSPQEKREASSAAETKSLFTGLSSIGLSLSKSSTSKEDEALPAEFGFNDNMNKSTEYHADFFLKWLSPFTVPSEGNTLLTPIASVEGHVSSADDSKTDAWSFRAGLELDTPFFGPSLTHANPVTGHVIGAPQNWLHIDANAKYETDRKFKAKQMEVELEITPDIPSLFISQTAYHYRVDREHSAQPLSPDDLKRNEPPVDFRWRPFLDLDAGSAIGNSNDSQSLERGTIFRIRPRAHADFWLNFVSHALQFHSTRVYGDYEYAYLPFVDGDRHHHLFETGAVFGFTKNVGFNLSYKVGGQSPTFQNERTLSGAVSVGF